MDVVDGGAVARGRRRVALAVAVAALAQGAARVAFVARGRFFACEDDPYRAYLGHLVAVDPARSLVGRFWLPGPLAATGALQWLGVAPAWSGVLLGALATAALAIALAGLARRLAPSELAPVAGPAAAALALASPMGLVLGHSQLADLPGVALLALAALGFVVRARGGSRCPLALGALALLAATTARYEAWPFALAAPPLAWLARRRADRARPSEALVDGAVAALALVGPAGWLLAQRAVYGDALAFLHRTSELSTALAGAPDRAAVLAHRASALVRWAPATLAFAAAGSALVRRRRALAPAAAFALAFAAPVLLEIASGREHAVFPDRFAFPVEIALAPLAAIGLAIVATHARRLAFALALAATVGTLALAVARPPAIADGDSVALGLALRAGALDDALRGGALVVERPRERPPFGWASVASLWARWDRVLFATPGERDADPWELVEAADPIRRRRVEPASLLDFLRARDATAIWTTTPRGAAALRALGLASEPRGRGTLAAIPP